MDLREIKAFMAVAQELNFRKAAEILNMTQPPLTRLISQMEMDLGVKLFVRSTRKVELTGAGLHLLEESRQLLEAFNRIENEVRSIGKLKTGNLKAGLYGPVFHSDLPRLISSFKDQFKGVNLDMSEVTYQNQLSALKNGKQDICFGERKIIEDGIGTQEVLQQELGFLMSSEHRLAKKKSLKLSDLKDETLIFHGKHENLGFQSEFYLMLKKKDINVKAYYKKSKESCPYLAVMGRGILLTSKEMSKNKMSGLTFVSMADYSSKLKIYANWSKSNQSLSLKAFLSFINEYASAPSSDMDYHLGK